MRSVIIFAGLALAASIVVPRYSQQMQRPPGTEAGRPNAVNAVVADGNSRSVVISRDGRGHFQVEGRVDGRQLDFMVDTGASVIALTESDAARLGIHPSHTEFSAQVRTANGTVRAAPVNLDMVEVGDIVVRDVPAVVLPDEALSGNLLGLSFLSRLRRFEYAEGKLVLEQ